MNWQDLQVAADHSHHQHNNTPAYRQRFTEVLAFHPPGLAAVRLGEQAWHIQADGQAAYAARFQRTFGFYEGLASVVTAAGWQHIDATGAAVYSHTYAWCGNFQDGYCSVRNADGDYWHILPAGNAAYPQRWHYVGDFRGGIAVVQAKNGYSTHINSQGECLHDVWFLDLDVFHKGFARARDEAGWLHINQHGKPIYTRRFAAVEPFYNGQARVECVNGALEVIDESGKTLVKLRPALRSEFAQLSADMVGFWRTQTIAAGVELGVFEQLPASTACIANHCHLSIEHSQRLLRALAELALIENQLEQWHCTERGQYLRSTHPQTLAGAAQEYAGAFAQMWTALPQALKQEGSWQKPSVFVDVAQDEQRRERHHQMLLSYAQHDYAQVPTALNLCGDETVLDAGGGLGALAQALLHAYPNLSVTVLERPEVIAQAKAHMPHHQALHYLPNDLFADWQSQAAVVILARVLHDWDDADALRILQRARAALSLGGKIVIIEMLLPDNNAAGGLCDLHLLMVTGGQERRLAEYEHLLTQADFSLSHVCKLHALPDVIVGIAGAGQ